MLPACDLLAALVMTPRDRPPSLYLLKRQAAACGLLGVLLVALIGALFFQHRQREWLLRCEQAMHRLDVASELISSELKSVRADALYLANRQAVQQFASGDTARRDELTADYIQFLQKKELFDQIRLLDLQGREVIRVNYSKAATAVVEASELQNKSDRYYFQESLKLQRGQIFVSEFDLNLEHGVIEKPLKPVIRFVTPVVDRSNTVSAFLVLNYLGAAMLEELDISTIPGFTMLLRPDGHYLHSPDDKDAWGWLLGHDRTFASQFPQEWLRSDIFSSCQLTRKGAFAAKAIPLGNVFSTANFIAPEGGRSPDAMAARESIVLVSFLPRDAVFSASQALLQRLLIVAAGVFALAIVFTRGWARATFTRQQQAARIAASEERLRELSARLLRIQEDERRAISREIHDELGQQATAINLDLKLAARSTRCDDTKQHLQRAIEENETLLTTLHEFARRVRPAVLDDLGLRDAMESHLAEFQQRTGVLVDAHLPFCSDEIPDNIADNVFRLLQESLNNVAKHADAAHVTVDVSLTGSDNKQLIMSVRDDGCGHDGTHAGHQLGLIGMRERVDLLAGEFEMQSNPNDGTSIQIRLPIGERLRGASLCD